MIRTRVIGCVAVFVLAALTGRAQNYEWTGAGGDDSWGTANNWTNNAVPAAVFTGRVAFVATDMGNPSVMDGNRKIVGTAASASQGLHYNPNSPSTLVHTTDLNSATLTLDGGSLQVGYNTSNSSAVIQNGTLRIGGVNKTDIMVGMNTVLTNCPGTVRLTIQGTLNLDNLGNLCAGRANAGNIASTRGGTLDLTGAAINSPLGPNTLKAANGLYVAGNNGGPPAPVEGNLLLPATLRSVEVGALYLGSERNTRGLLDFGPGSGVTNFNCQGVFAISYEGYGAFQNMPTGLTFTVGTPTVPADFYLGYLQNWSGSAVTGVLVIADSVFSANLKNVVIGQHYSGNPYFVTSRLDISSCEVRAPAINQFKADFLTLGSRYFGKEGAGRAYGTLRLPPAVTNLDFAVFQFGAEYQGMAEIDIGTNSQLKTISVTNALYWGGGYGSKIGYDTGSGFVEYLPAGIEIQVGRASKYATNMNVGAIAVNPSRTIGMTAALTITNGTFTGYMETLRVGLNMYGTANVIRASVNLSQATLGALNVSGNAYIGYWQPTSNSNAYGIVSLPVGVASIASNLYLGARPAKSGGLLDLYGTTVNVGGKVDVERTGVVTTRVYSVSCGLDLASSSTNDFQIAPSGRVHIVFSELAPKIWGLRMAGDQRSYFQDLHDAGRLTWSASPHDAQIAYVDGKTVVRLPPVAGSLLLIR